jgi:sugar-specific transcriptional regulator TrmB
MNELALKEFGLTDKEIKVYLALLNLGTALVQEISERAGTYRTYTYEILKSLKEKGLVSYVIKSGKQYYEIAPPEKLISILKEKERKINEIIPNLKKIYETTTEKPRTEVYEGLEGLKTILDDMIKTKKEILVYGSTQNMHIYLMHNFPQYIKRRVNAGIYTKIVDTKSTDSEKMNKKSKEELREMRFLPEIINFPTTTNIYGNKVSIMSFKDDFVGIIIDNKDIANTQRQIFNLLWSLSKIIT